MLESTDAPQSNKSHKAILQPMGLGGILDAILSLYRNHFRLFLGIAVFYFSLIALQEAVVVFLLEMSSTPSFDNFVSDMDTVLDALVYMLIVGVLIAACSEIYLGKRATIQSAFQCLRSHFWEYLGATLIYLILFSILILNSMASLQDSAVIGLIPFLCSPFLLYFLIGCWVFYGPVIFHEKWTASESLQRSRTLGHGSRGRVFGIVLAILLFQIGVGYILGNSLGVVLALFGIVGDGSVVETIGDLLAGEYTDMRPTSLDALIMYIVYLGAETFTLPIYGIGVTLLYFDLRIRKEGFDIEMQARNAQDLM